MDNYTALWAVLVLGFTEGALFLKRSFWVSKLKLIFLISVLGIFSVLAYYTYSQYTLWASHPLSRYLLPPYQPVSYFLDYIGTRLYIYHWFLALAAAYILGIIAIIINKKFSWRFMEKEEPRLLALGVFLSGYPGLFLYFFVFFILFLLINLFITLRNKRAVRVSAYYLWIISAIVGIIINKLFIGETFWKSFYF